MKQSHLQFLFQRLSSPEQAAQCAVQICATKDLNALSSFLDLGVTTPHFADLIASSNVANVFLLSDWKEGWEALCHIAATHEHYSIANLAASSCLNRAYANILIEAVWNNLPFQSEHIKMEQNLEHIAQMAVVIDDPELYEACRCAFPNPLAVEYGEEKRLHEAINLNRVWYLQNCIENNRSADAFIRSQRHMHQSWDFADIILLHDLALKRWPKNTDITYCVDRSIMKNTSVWDKEHWQWLMDHTLLPDDGLWPVTLGLYKKNILQTSEVLAALNIVWGKSDQLEKKVLLIDIVGAAQENGFDVTRAILKHLSNDECYPKLFEGLFTTKIVVVFENLVSTVNALTDECIYNSAITSPILENWRQKVRLEQALECTQAKIDVPKRKM